MKYRYLEETRKQVIEFENPFEVVRLLLEFSQKSRYDLSFYSRWKLPRPHDQLEHDDIDDCIRRSIYDYIESDQFKKLESEFGS